MSVGFSPRMRDIPRPADCSAMPIVNMPHYAEGAADGTISAVTGAEDLP